MRLRHITEICSVWIFFTFAIVPFIPIYLDPLDWGECWYIKFYSWSGNLNKANVYYSLPVFKAAFTHKHAEISSSEQLESATYASDPCAVGVCPNRRDTAVYHQPSSHFSFPQSVSCPRHHPCCFPLLFIHSDNHPDLCSFFLQSQPVS